MKASDHIAEKNRKGYGNYMITNAKVSYEINRINVISNRKRKLNSLK